MKKNHCRGGGGLDEKKIIAGGSEIVSVPPPPPHVFLNGIAHIEHMQELKKS